MRSDNFYKLLELLSDLNLPFELDARPFPKNRKLKFDIWVPSKQLLIDDHSIVSTESIKRKYDEIHTNHDGVSYIAADFNDFPTPGALVSAAIERQTKFVFPDKLVKELGIDLRSK